MKGRFEGWYFKHQVNGATLAVIPGRSEDKAFVQVITGHRSYQVDYPLNEYRRTGVIRVGKSVFSRRGVKLNIEDEALSLHGTLRYGDLTCLHSDIMGFFQFFHMECRHAVLSMNHELTGSVTLCGEPLCFDGGKGYIEADSGCSFPAKYMWVQCNDFSGGLSIMASAAQIPFIGSWFWGCICAIRLNGHEYRIATYKGAKISRCAPGVLTLEQGKYRLEIAVDTRTGYELSAPEIGVMNRTIRESVSCPAHFRFICADKILFDKKSSHASYEYDM